MNDYSGLQKPELIALAKENVGSLYTNVTVYNMQNGADKGRLDHGITWNLCNPVGKASILFRQLQDTFLRYNSKELNAVNSISDLDIITVIERAKAADVPELKEAIYHYREACENRAGETWTAEDERILQPITDVAFMLKSTQSVSDEYHRLLKSIEDVEPKYRKIARNIKQAVLAKFGKSA
jgi:hypothetical protein